MSRRYILAQWGWLKRSQIPLFDPVKNDISYYKQFPTAEAWNNYRLLLVQISVILFPRVISLLVPLAPSNSNCCHITVYYISLPYQYLLFTQIAMPLLYQSLSRSIDHSNRCHILVYCCCPWVRVAREAAGKWAIALSAQYICRLSYQIPPRFVTIIYYDPS